MSANITFSSHLYVGESMSARKLDKIKTKLLKNPIACGAFVISLSKNEHDQLDIMQAGQLAQRFYQDYSLQVVGIASNQREAIELVEKMIQECLKLRGDCRVKEYLVCGF